MTDAAPPLERNRYFLGKLMTVEDFRRDQDYVLRALAEHRLHNHGPGVVSGLALSLEREGDQVTLQVDRGLAIDRQGRALRLTGPRRLELDPEDDRSLVLLHYREVPGQPVPALESGAVTGGVEYGLVQELTEISLAHGAEQDDTSLELGTLVRADDGSLGVVASCEPTRLVELGWPHGGELSLDQLAQADWTLALTFSQALQPASGAASGPQKHTCRVALEHQGTGCRVSVLRAVRLAQDGRQLQLELDEQALTKVAAEDGDALWLHVSLSLDFLPDQRGRPVVGRLLGGDLPTAGTPAGGLFESWFRMTEDATERRAEETTRD